MRRTSIAIISAIAGFGLASTSFAAALTFQDPVAIGSGTGSAAAVQFSPGTIVSATDFGGGNQTTAAGVAFVEHGSTPTAATIIKSSTGSTTTANTAGFHQTDDVTLNSALGDFTYDGNPTIIQVNGLTIGQQYSVQLFAIDDRPEGMGGGARSVHFSDGTNNSATFVEMTNVYVVATFTADQTYQQIDSYGTGRPGFPDDTGSNFNAVIVRAVPEPATLGIIAVGAIGFLARRRRV